MIGVKMLKKWVFCSILLPLLFPLPYELSQAFANAPPTIQIEKLRFFDWEAGASPLKRAKKNCYIQVSGFSHDRIFLSIRLSMLKASAAASDQNALSIIKISATKVFQEDFSDAFPIRLSEAWLETSTATTLGRLKKIIDTEAHFIGGMPGNGLFNALLQGMRKAGLIVGYRTETNPLARIFDLGVPPPHLFETLKICLMKGAVIF